MRARIAEALGDFLARCAVYAGRRSGRVGGAVALFTLLCLAYAAFNLGVNTDNKRLLSEDLSFQRDWRDFARHFPTLDDAILVVVDGETTDLAREGAERLAERLRKRPELFSDVFLPGAGPFFERSALLYRSPEELGVFVDELWRLQPFLAELTRDLSLANLTELLRSGLEDSISEGEGADDWSPLLEGFRRATVSVYHEYPLRLSWEDLLLDESGFDPVRRRVIVVEPVLEFERILAAARPIREIRRVASELELVPSRGVRVRLTGNPVLNHEEMLGLLWDVGVAGLLSFALVSCVLVFALRSTRMVLAAAGTLLAGLVWTGAFAALAVGRLNLVSVCVAVLFVGLGVDFAIHLGMHYARRRRQGEAHEVALRSALGRVGTSLVLCAFTTAIGFLCFVPTDFRGIAELGLIAAGGMLAVFLLTVMLFPALLGSDPAPPREPVSGFEAALRRRIVRSVDAHPGRIVAAAVLLALGAGLLAPRVRFEPNVVELRDPDTESVRTFEDLLADGEATPWTVDAMASDPPRVQALAQRLRRHAEVDRALILEDYVPADQAEKLAILEEASMMIFLTPEQEPGSQLPAAQQIAALRELHGFLAPGALDGSSKISRAGRLLRRELGSFLERVEDDPEPEVALQALEQRLLGGFPRLMRRLQRALEVRPVSLESLPPDLVRRMRTPEGLSRVQVFASENLEDPLALARFVDTVRAEAPHATGLPVNLVELGRATSASLRRALGVAALCICLLLLGLWRSLSDVASVFATLALGALLSVASVVLLGLSYNFANVIVVPLLLGVGVDSGIHLVERWRAGEDAGSLDPATARAVFYSALTTIASFGSLTLSSHRGIASLGLLLVLGMLGMAASNLVFLPALLRLRDRLTASR